VSSLAESRAARPEVELTAARDLPPPARAWVLVVLAALGVALASLLLPSEPTYDPWAWLIWSREIAEGTLSTTNGPSWKPLPVLVSLPFALLGHDVAPAAWLVIARAGGLLALAMTYRLGTRLAGRAAGAIAAAALLLADEFVHNFARGNSEGLLLALVLFAVERHLDGRRGPAFALGIAAGLLRPEVWPFLGLYGLWLAWREPHLRLLVAAGFLALIALWLGPEWWGSGNPLRASDRARQPNPDSAAFASFPFLEVFRRSGSVLMVPVLVAAAAGLALRPRGLRLAFATCAAVLMVMVAAMTQAGYAGNLRYVALPAALLCALAGAGCVDLVRRAGARRGRGAATAVAVLLAAVSLPFAVGAVGALGTDLRLVRDEAALYGELDHAIESVGGVRAATRCPVFTGRFDTMPLAWRLKLRVDAIGIFPSGPGTVFAARRFSLTRPQPSALSRDPRYPVAGGTERWAVRARC
jgi:hypothetical protein